jgi:hypothetical protein
MVLPLLEISITRDFLMAQRQALLMQLDALERLLDISPRTAELRKEHRNGAQVRVELECEKKEGTNGT